MEHENHRRKKEICADFFHVRDSIREKLWASIWHFLSSMTRRRGGGGGNKDKVEEKSHKKLTLG